MPTAWDRITDKEEAEHRKMSNGILYSPSRSAPLLKLDDAMGSLVKHSIALLSTSSNASFNSPYCSFPS